MAFFPKSSRYQKLVCKVCSAAADANSRTLQAWISLSAVLGWAGGLLLRLFCPIVLIWVFQFLAAGRSY
jgi:hypothetical protein